MTLEELNKKSDNWDFIIRDGEIKESIGYSADICTGDTVLKLDNLIEIPKRATNGDMFVAVFKPYKAVVYLAQVQVYLTEQKWQMFGISWWNAPYKKE